MEILAIIPARSGSQRLAGKNVKLLAGKLLITYTIEQAQASKLITKIVVVTDDDNAKAIALKMGVQALAEPSGLAADHILMPVVIQWAVANLEKYQDYKPLYIVLLQPTSPLRTSEDIDACIEIVKSNQGDSLTTVRQDGTENGAVYVINRYYAMNGLMYGPRLYKYSMPDTCVDIDTQEDWDNAERLISRHETSQTDSDSTLTSVIPQEKKPKRQYHRKQK